MSRTLNGPISAPMWRTDSRCWRGLLCLILVTAMLAGCDGLTKSDPGTRRDQPCSARSVSWDFDSMPAGHIPPGWLVRETNPTTALAKWAVVADPAAPSGRQVFALTETSNHGGTFNLAVAESTSFKDLDLSVRVKAVKGEEDQGGGPIWRCRDDNNYYICRINPLESNYRVYKVVDGKRQQLDSAKVELETSRWYTLRVTTIGNRMTCYLDGQELLHAADDTLAEAGMVGLWTKADAVTSFDDLTVDSLNR